MDPRALRGLSGSIPAHTGKPAGLPPCPVGFGVYPRPHGEATPPAVADWIGRGLSPPTRGSRVRHGLRRFVAGSIPAHTGKPRSQKPQLSRRAVYPRPHGEAAVPEAPVEPARGLSPPTRGSPAGPAQHPPTVRSIPAHTGKPSPAVVAANSKRVYPRPHGEAAGIADPPMNPRGLSPPTRGSRTDLDGHGRRVRSIPAHTGKPSPAEAHQPTRRVYPRPHGEAGSTERPDRSPPGLSPPTRGSRRAPGRHDAAARSIPAHMGKPSNGLRSMCSSKVYPRPHGEAPDRSFRRPASSGLSPPTRGSLSLVDDLDLQQGSIPAHTGKPRTARPSCTTPRVYPRPHGEADTGDAETWLVVGLSPPTRGSRPSPPGRGRWRGSIPAHTGKPTKVPLPSRLTQVYPRPHGEATPPATSMTRDRGLSPPTRGSLLGEHALDARRGSIPAHTGKPLTSASGATLSRVYPRPHGEAASSALDFPPGTGLSPPTRGSRADRGVGDGPGGSIPAHTGKPERLHDLAGQQEVYPRPHGEAGVQAQIAQRFQGLSPPTRGSLRQRRPRGQAHGSIPAHTGKPR